ncbi:MAG: phosphoenolpyruvate--protein phosphotransferase [Calditrichia bacterium]
MNDQTKDSQTQREIVLKGTAASPGIVLGPVFLHQEEVWIPEKCSISPDQVAREIEIFQKAVRNVQEQLGIAFKKMSQQYGDDLAEVLLMQLGLLEDKYFLGEVETAIEEKLLEASYATFVIFRQKKEMFLEMSDEYFKDRAFDIQSLKKLLINEINDSFSAIDLQEPAVVIAANLSPSDTVHLHQQKVLGFVTNAGGKNSHTAIVARSLGVPAVVGIHNATEATRFARRVVIDGGSGKVILNPTAETIAEFTQLRDQQNSSRAQLLKDASLETRTLDGRRIAIQANIEFEGEMNNVMKVDADGIGLFRTEGIFLDRTDLPSEDEQTEIYRAVAEQMHPHEVVIRTLDIGGDKILPDLIRAGEDNPFLGWRAIRFWLDHKTGFLAQFKAILRANTLGNIKILLPMVSGLEEIFQIKELFEEAKQQLRDRGLSINEDIPIGMMIEIPSAVVMADMFAAEVDFFSVGTNDLVQYTLAVDRGNEKISRLYSHFHPAILRMLKQVSEAAARANIPVTVCGEMAGDPAALPLLLAMDYTSLSASNMVIPGMKKIVRELAIKDCLELHNQLLTLQTSQEIEKQAVAFVAERFPVLLHGREA